jgi:hypothetical protein
MNSGRKVEQEQPFGDWLSKAKRKFVGATIHNFGQFAVCVMDHKNVHLFDDFFAAVDFMAGHAEYRLHDLAEEPVHKMNLPCSNIKAMSDYEDRLYERRLEREQRQA